MRKSLLLILTLVFLSSCSEPIDETFVSKDDKLQKLDHELQEMQAKFPIDYGNGWIHTAASRENNTIAFEYEASRPNEGEYNHEWQKHLVIENIQSDPWLSSIQLDFKITYRFKDGKTDTIYVSPEEYTIKWINEFFT